MKGFLAKVGANLAKAADSIAAYNTPQAQHQQPGRRSFLLAGTHANTHASAHCVH